MTGRILGVSIGTIMVVVITAILVRKFGGSVPLLKSI